jgi:16S rRNA (uracil1498-N3)-methyltransferase
MSRFYAPCELTVGRVCALPDATVKHMQVHRLQPGQEVEVFNGQGGAHRVRIERMTRQDIDVTVLFHQPEERESARAVQLAVAMPANDRMDWLVEKATELGVHRITPLMSARSVLKLDGDRAIKKWGHWQAIAAHACAQCGRNRLPHIDAPERLSVWIEQRPSTALWGVLSPQATLSLHAAMATEPWLSAASMAFLLGPEGGLTDEELAHAGLAGAQPLSLGPRVLRVETAALAALVTCGAGG